MGLKEPSNRVHNDTLKNQIKHFKQGTKDLKADAKWVQQIAEEPVSEDAQLVSPAEVDPEVAEALFFVKVTWKEGDRHETLIFESNPFQGARDISDLPDSLRQQLVECARKT